MEVINPFYIRYTSLPSYQEFYENVMSKNILCVFPSVLTQEWECRKNWVTARNDIDFRYLEKNYGNMECPVYKCNEKYFNSNPTSKMCLKEYIEYWKRVRDCNHRYDENQLNILYLKDWHLFSDPSLKNNEDTNKGRDKDRKETRNNQVFILPVYFEADYLNDYCVAKGLTDYKFVYLGPKDSSTPLHIDVFGSFSWSANICGRKRWLFIPEAQVPLLKQLIGSDLPQSLYSLKNFRDICEKVQAFEFIQHPGETVFVPSGYMHEVLNLEDTISINHNWFNACNLQRILHSLLSAYKDVQKEIEDLKHELTREEWLRSCDKILIIHFGMNFETFTNILEYNLYRILNEKFAAFHYEDDVKALKDVLYALDQETK